MNIRCSLLSLLSSVFSFFFFLFTFVLSLCYPQSVVCHLVCCQLESQVAHARNESCIVEQCLSFVNANLSSNLESPVGNAGNES
jgi:hypothetical protein